MSEPEPKDQQPLTFSEDEMKPPESVEKLIAHWGNRADEVRGKLTAYIAFLLETNQKFNMTAGRTPADQWTQHVGDALQVAILMEKNIAVPGSKIRIVDIGPGGGVPGLIWGILWPWVVVHLIEATGKKARFLQEARDLLNLERVKVINDRAEKLAHDPQYRERYDWVTARGLAALPVLAQWTVPFAKVDGRIVAIKGTGLDEEMKSAEEEFKTLGAQSRPSVVPYERPDAKACSLLIYAKKRITPPALPNVHGIAIKKTR